MTRVIGLDLGTYTGYAWTDTFKVVAPNSGVLNLTPRRHEGGGMRFLRFRQLVKRRQINNKILERLAPR